MRIWLVLPLCVSALSLAWVFFANRRPRLTGLRWPDGMTLSGPVDRPDLRYDGDVVLGGSGCFGTIRCRSLLVARGADVQAHAIEAGRLLRVDGRVCGARLLASGRRIEVRGELFAEDLQAPQVLLRSGSRSVVLTVSGPSRIHRHPKAEAKGFFADLAEMGKAGVILRDRAIDADDTEPPMRLR